MFELKVDQSCVIQDKLPDSVVSQLKSWYCENNDYWEMSYMGINTYYWLSPTSVVIFAQTENRTIDGDDYYYDAGDTVLLLTEGKVETLCSTYDEVQGIKVSNSGKTITVVARSTYSGENRRYKMTFTPKGMRKEDICYF